MEWMVRTIRDFSEKELTEAYGMLSEERKLALARINKKERVYASILGEWMAREMLSKYSGMPKDQIRLARTPKGKPYAENLPYHFNISHSGQWVACAVSHRPIGIDIEAVRPLDLKLATRICSPQDLNYFIKERTFLGRQRRLYEIFTAKEAYFKAKGTGITHLQGVSLADLQPRLLQLLRPDYILSIYQE